MKKALVLFHSQQYGNTELMARAIGEGLGETGLEVVLHNTNDLRFDIEDFPQYECIALAIDVQVRVLVRIFLFPGC
jgi:flavodoxin